MARIPREALIDYFPEDTRDIPPGEWYIRAVFPLARLSGGGQCFTTPSRQYRLSSAKLYCRIHRGSPVGNLSARIYPLVGTPGVDGRPSGIDNYLAESGLVSMSSLPLSYGWVTFTFSGANRIVLDPNTYYCLCFIAHDATLLDVWNGIAVAIDSSGEIHGGNTFRMWDNQAWVTNVWDTPFYLHGWGP